VPNPARFDCLIASEAIFNANADAGPAPMPYTCRTEDDARASLAPWSSAAINAVQVFGGGNCRRLILLCIKKPEGKTKRCGG